MANPFLEGRARHATGGRSGTHRATALAEMDAGGSRRHERPGDQTRREIPAERDHAGIVEVPGEAPRPAARIANARPPHRAPTRRAAPASRVGNAARRADPVPAPGIPWRPCRRTRACRTARHRPSAHGWPDPRPRIRNNHRPMPGLGGPRISSWDVSGCVYSPREATARIAVCAGVSRSGPTRLGAHPCIDAQHVSPRWHHVAEGVVETETGQPRLLPVPPVGGRMRGCGRLPWPNLSADTTTSNPEPSEFSSAISRT